MASKTCPAKGAIQFFRRQAGYSYGRGESRRAGHIRNARDLAAAECVLHASGKEVVWEQDESGLYEARKEGREPDEVLCAMLKGDSLTSVCGIEDPSREQARVMEAELAWEAFPRRVRPLAARLAASRGKPVALGAVKPRKRRRRR